MLLHLLRTGVAGLVLGFLHNPATNADLASSPSRCCSSPAFVAALVASPPARRRQLLACALMAVAG